MEVLSGLDSIRKRLERYRKDDRKLFFFDYDGTLAPFVKKRDKAYMYKELIPVIDDLIKDYPGKVFFVSGRSVDSIIPLLSCLKKIPEIWGSHGNEQYINGKVNILSYDHKNQLEEIKQLIDRQDLADHSEKKVISLTLHKRDLPLEKIEKIEEIIDIVRLSYPKLEIKKFDGGYEILVPHKNKGDAVKKVMERYKDHLPIYFGDDLTDEDAFIAIKDTGISFLVRKEFRKTNAHIWIEPPFDIIRIFKEGLCQIVEDL